MFRLLQLPFDDTVKLASYYSSQNINVSVKASMITHTMRVHTVLLEPITRIAPKSHFTCSLCVGGAMALLQGGCNLSIIKLLARWKSDTVRRYLHL